MPPRDVSRAGSKQTPLLLMHKACDVLERSFQSLLGLTVPCDMIRTQLIWACNGQMIVSPIVPLCGTRHIGSVDELR